MPAACTCVCHACRALHDELRPYCCLCRPTPPPPCFPSLPPCPHLPSFLSLCCTQVIRKQDYSPASDVYAFGLIMWELLTWQLPWEQASPFQVGGRAGVVVVVVLGGGMGR